jgi:hypothetical protein
VLKAVETQKAFLAVAAVSKKPDDKTLQTIFAPTADLINKISGTKDNRSKFANNLATVSEAISVLQWVLVVCERRQGKGKEGVTHTNTDPHTRTFCQ